MGKPLSKEFLLDRGTCCGNKCTNCPYYPKWNKGSVQVFKVPNSVNCTPSCSMSTMQEGLCICYLDYLIEKDENKESRGQV